MKKRYILAIWIAALALSFLIDKQFLNFIISLRNPIFDGFMKWVSYVGSTLIVLLIITSLFLWEERKKEWIPILFASALVSLVISELLKYTFMRPRPDVIQLVKESNPGLPSNHVTVAFSTVPILDKEFPKLAWFWILFAVLVALSRIYLGVHYLSDVVAGGLIGYSISTLTIYAEKRYGIFKFIR